MSHSITNQRDLRRAFWEAHPAMQRRLKYKGPGAYTPTDTRCAFVDYVDSLCRDGTISEALAHRATLD